MIHFFMIKTRFAPSPTGLLHMGSVRALLLPFLFARKHNGHFLLRIDDTDKERSKQEYEDDIFTNLHWLNVDFDETFRQSDRLQIYEDYFCLLKDHGLIYECFETAEDIEQVRTRKKLQRKPPIFTKKDRTRSEGASTWRLELNAERFYFEDIIQGPMEFGLSWSDPIIKKTDGSFPYTFVSVVDDLESNITHIIRGEDHISNTAVQKFLGDQICQIQRGKTWEIQFAHFSFFLDSEGHKLSKRNLESNLAELRDLEPMTFWSLLTTLGTNKNQIFSINPKDYFAHFDLNSFSKSKQKFSYDLLRQTSSKIFHLSPKPEPISQDAWNLLKHNANDLRHLLAMLESLTIFLQSSSILKTMLLEGCTIAKISEHLKCTTPECYRFIYQQIFNQNFGPKLEDVVSFINKQTDKLT